MFIALVILFAVYFVLMILLMRGWKYAVHPLGTSTGRTDELITVIIPARNEQVTIGALLEDLGRQKTENFEVIVVDDHSDDNTAGVVRSYAAKASYRLTLLHPGAMHGKKNCLAMGVHHANGSIVLATDADCRVGEEWIATLRRCFDRTNTRFVSGPVRIHRDGTLGTALQAIEFASLVGSGAAAIGSGHPVMCNGANMAFRKETFLKVGGYEGNRHIASGDDEFLMHKIHHRYPGSVMFCSAMEAAVETYAAPWPHFFSQRIRWAGKWKAHGISLGALAAILIFLFHFSLLTLLPATIMTYPYLVAMLLTGKMVLEYSFLRTVCRFLGVTWSWTAFFLLQLIYSPYAVAIGTAANFGSTTWKGRKIKSHRVEMRSRFAENP